MERRDDDEFGRCAYCQVIYRKVNQEYRVEGVEGGAINVGLAIDAHRLWLFIEPDSAGSAALNADRAEFLARRLTEMAAMLRELDVKAVE